MSRQVLNLGAILSELLTKANANFNDLYTAVEALQEANGDGNIQKAVVYDSASAMMDGLNSNKDANNKDLNLVVGDEIYILDEGTPDFWVVAINQTSTTGSIPSSWNNNENYTFGKYTIRPSKSREIDLADYQRISNLVTSINVYSTHDQYPSAKAVLETIVSRLAAFSNTYATKEELANAGKVKDVQLNGESVLDATTGVANIDLSNISVGGEDLKAEIKTATLINYPSDSDIQYKAIKMPKTSVVIEVLKKVGNDDYSAVITQSIVVGEFTYYLLDKSATGNYYYREVGGKVVGGGSSNNAKTVDLYQHFVIFQIPVSFNYNTVTHNATAFVPLSFVGKYPTAWSGIINIASNGMSTCGGHIAFESENPEDSFKFSKFGIVTSFSLSYNSDAGILTCSLFGKILERTGSSIEGIGLNYIPVSKTMELNGTNLLSESVSKFTLEVT